MRKFHLATLCTFFLSLLCAGCAEDGFFQAEIHVYQIGGGSGFYIRMDESKISVFDDAIELNEVLEVNLTNDQAREIKTMLSRIPFPDLEKRYSAERIDDGAGMALSVRLDTHGWPSVLIMSNCRIKEVADFVQIAHAMIEGAEHAEDVLYFLNDIPDALSRECR